MKKAVERLMSGATRLLVLALGLGLTATGWGAASLEETGATVPTTATLAFKGATLSQVTADTLSGVIGGDWAGNIAGNAMTFNNFDRTSEASGTITCQAQIQHDTNVKGVLLTFTQDGSNVKVQKTGAKYISGTVGSSIAGGTDGYYDVNKLQLNIARIVPNACWVENFPSSSTTVNGVSLNPVNGSSTVTDGVITYGNPSDANGPAFSFSAAGYVAVVFTVDFTGVTLAANQILFTLGNGSNNGLVGAALKSNGSGGFYATGIWVDGGWTTADDSSNTFTLSGEQTFLAIYNKGEDAATKGTHLYVLDNGVAKVLYGGSSGIGLKGGDVTKLGIGGAFGSSGSFTNMPGLKLKKVAIYLSSSSLPMVASDLPGHSYMAKFAVANGETINASTINAGVTTFGSAYVSTEAGATINLDAELNGHTIVFDGSISGVPGSADGLTLGSVNDKVTLTNASYVPVIKGRGTVVYPDNTIPSSDSTGWLTSSDWAGTLSLNNIQGSNNTQPGWYTPFHNYGSANSTIKVSGFTGFFGAGNFESSATLEIAAGSTFTLNNGNNGNSMTFAKLKGSGNIVICGNNGPAIQYVMRDASEFAGNITVSQSGSSVFKKSIVLGGGSSYNYNVNNYQKQICVLGNVTVAAGKTWTADSGIVVNGTLTKADSTATLSGTITGSGKIIYNDELPNSADFTANTWTGTVEVNGGATTSAGIEAANATQFMNAGSTFSVASGTVTLGTAAGLTGAVNVNSGATLQIVDSTATDISLAGTNNGTVNLQMASALTTLTLSDGIARGTVVYPNTLTTLNVALTETIADDGLKAFTASGATLTGGTLTLTKLDGTTETITGTASSSTVSFSWTPTVSGAACWCDYEFNGNKNSTGTDTTGLTSDVNTTTYPEIYDNSMLYTYTHPWRNISYEDNWTAVVRCTVPMMENAIVVMFGTYGAGAIGLAAGPNPATQMNLVSTPGSSATTSEAKHFTTLATMTVKDATTAQHVYVFTKEGTTVNVYCDGSKVLENYVLSSGTLGGGLQVGSLHGGVVQNGVHTGLIRFGAGESQISSLSLTDQQKARIDCMRMYKGVLGPNAIAQLSVEFPAVKLFEATVAANDNKRWDELTWSTDWDGGNAQSTIVLTVEGDATLELPASITAHDFTIDVASGATLTLVEPAGGTTMTLTSPLEVNGGTIVYAAAASKTMTVNGTGSLKFANGTTITGALSGTAKVEIPSGSTVGVMGGSIANQITGSGVLAYMALPSSALSFSSWTGTVQLPAIASGGIIFNNYGTTGSTVYLTSMSGAWIDPSYTTINPKLYLAGNMTLAAMSTRTYTFAEIDGSGDLSFATSGDQPTAINITKVAEGYTGTISSTLETPVTIATLDRAAGTSTAGGTKLLATSGDVAASALTVGGAAQQVGLCTAVDGIYVACTVTIPEVANATAAVTVDGVAATGSSPYTVDVGSDVEITWTAASGYKITAGATQTINAIATDVTATAPTVEANSVTFSNFAVEYLADFSKAAKITATVTGDGAAEAAYTLTVGETGYNGTYNSETGKVTFNNVGILSLGDTLSYTISATGTASGTSTPQTSTVGNVTDGWVVEDSTHYETTGSWATDFTYTDGKATLTDNTYTANTAGDGIVTLTTVVKFGDDADPEVAVGTAQAALRVQNGKFEVYGKTTSEGAAAWQATSVDADSEATYRVVIVVNYTTGTFTMTVAKGEEAAQSLGRTWYLATDAGKVSQIAYKGTGEFTSLVGSFISSDIEVTVDTEDEVSVSGDFISRYLGGETISAATALLAPDSPTTASNGYNYFSNYALGLDPRDADDKPTIKVETNSEGKFVVTLVDGDGERIEGAANVALTLKFQSGTDPNSLTTETISSFSEGSATIDPTTMEGNVQYYKVRIDIGAK